VTCKPSDNNESCTVPVTFQPLYPGGAGTHFSDGRHHPPGYGIALRRGRGAAGAGAAGSLVNTYGNNNSYFYQSVTDENGTVWSISSNVNTLTSLTTEGIFTTFRTRACTLRPGTIAMEAQASSTFPMPTEATALLLTIRSRGSPDL